MIVDILRNKKYVNVIFMSPYYYFRYCFSNYHYHYYFMIMMNIYLTNHEILSERILFCHIIIHCILCIILGLIIKILD